MKAPLSEAELDALLVSATTMAQWNDEGDLYLRLIAEIRALRGAARTFAYDLSPHPGLPDDWSLEEYLHHEDLPGSMQPHVSDIRRLRDLVPEPNPHVPQG